MNPDKRTSYKLLHVIVLPLLVIAGRVLSELTNANYCHFLRNTFILSHLMRRFIASGDGIANQF
jgi:hypothetical protein